MTDSFHPGPALTASADSDWIAKRGALAGRANRVKLKEHTVMQRVTPSTASPNFALKIQSTPAEVSAIELGQGRRKHGDVYRRSVTDTRKSYRLRASWHIICKADGGCAGSRRLCGEGNAKRTVRARCQRLGRYWTAIGQGKVRRVGSGDLGLIHFDGRTAGIADGNRLRRAGSADLFRCET